ncbi:putative oxidoreductase SadH [Pillotina sp. SPG140]
MQNSIVLITGGASGIGAYMARECAERGATVVVWDINETMLRGLETTVPGITTMRCNVADRADVYYQAEQLQKTVGHVDILINNAGVVSGTTVLETPDDSIIHTFNVNVLAHFWTVKAFLPSMLTRNSGHIVTIASAAGLIGVKGLADYSASKFAVFGFDEALRMELRSRKSAVKTTVVCPFFIDTGMFKGVKTKFPLLLPILNKEKTAHKIIHAILQQKKRLIIPPFVYSTVWLRLFPPTVLDILADFFGINHSMDDFVGRISKK